MRIRRHDLFPLSRLRPGLLYWGSVVCLFLVTHGTQDRLADIARSAPVVIPPDVTMALLSYAPRVKGILFLLSLASLSAPIVRDGFRLVDATRGSGLVSTLGVSFGTVLVLLLLVFQPGNLFLGEEYAIRSVAPFSQDVSWVHQRLLMPATAHVLFFRGGWLYYAFGVLVVAVLLGLVYNWLRTHAPLPWWQFVSLCTCSFAIFQFQVPGYPDVLAFACFVVVMTDGFSQPSKLALLVLALLTHEGAAVMGLLLAYRYLDRRLFALFLGTLMLYGLIWMGSAHFDLGSLLSSNNVAGLSGFEWVIQHPTNEILGLFFGFKATWLLVAVAAVMSIHEREWEDASFLICSVCIGIFMTFLGVDTSRLVGFAFPMVLVAIPIIRRHLAPRSARRLLSGVLLLNLLIPSFYLGLNTELWVQRGLYGFLYSLVISAGRLGGLGF